MALVQFEKAEEAEKALKALRGAELKPGLKLFVSWKKDRKALEMNPGIA